MGTSQNRNALSFGLIERRESENKSSEWNGVMRVDGVKSCNPTCSAAVCLIARPNFVHPSMKRKEGHEG